MNIKHLIFLALGLVVLYLLIWPSEKDHLNAQMTELCKKDGGVKVYERVTLSAEMFDESGLLKSRDYVKDGDSYVLPINNDYKLIEKSIIIKNGDPFKDGLLTRTHKFIQRVSDGKVMAEAVQYGRGGGDRWFAGMPSSEDCPNMPINLIELSIVKK